MREAIFHVWVGGLCLLPVAWAVIIWKFWGEKDTFRKIDRNIALIFANVAAICWNVLASIAMRLI